MIIVKKKATHIAICAACIIGFVAIMLFGAADTNAALKDQEITNVNDSYTVHAEHKTKLQNGDSANKNQMLTITPQLKYSDKEDPSFSFSVASGDPVVIVSKTKKKVIVGAYRNGTYPLTISVAKTKTHNAASRTVMITVAKSNNAITGRVSTGYSEYDASSSDPIKDTYTTKTFWTDVMRISNDAGLPISVDPFETSEDLYRVCKTNKRGSVYYITTNAKKPVTISYMFRTEGDDAYNSAERMITVNTKTNFAQKGAYFVSWPKKDYKSFFAEIAPNPYAEKYRIHYKKNGTNKWKAKEFTQAKLLGDKWWKTIEEGVTKTPVVTGLTKNAKYEVYMSYYKNGKWYDYKTKRGKKLITKLDLSKRYDPNRIY